ncbi:Uu.00g022030.m01.CDS01 [Anthostomella pinea]|uniref:Uu.00g022030.m01.CDS01 n=1 Tax=Anthostomella pinea TaxID=933095 RepID=A0AAI8W0F4_9PEZI|nr:Uu.00g022030.m01.CDS01 [Anthostomella pinea]
MLFAEADTPLLKAWIVKRLANTSDADADVLADYVLALLRHDGELEVIRQLFEEEIPDFLREDAAAFTDDVFQAVQYRSYLPGAPPPPPISRQQLSALPPVAPAQNVPRLDVQPPFPTYAQPPTGPALGPGGSRKRSYNDRDDKDVDIILTSQSPYGGPQPFKQPRRGGGFSQRGAIFDRFDDPYDAKNLRGGHNPYGAPHGPAGYAPPQSYSPSPHGSSLPPLDANSLMENIQRLQQLGIPIPQIPQLPELPKPVYSGSTIAPSPRRRKQRCRDYDTKGFCQRGNNCIFQHGTESLHIPPFRPPAGDEYDPASASLPPMPSFSNLPAAPELPPLDKSAFEAIPPATRREPKKPRRMKGRAPFAMNGPMHDRSKTVIAVQNIPAENYSEDQIRAYFSQFGTIANISMQEYNRLATIKFDTWEEANAAWSSPKVIFDNRFVKVFWYKDKAEAGTAPSGKPAGALKNGSANGHAATSDTASAEPEFDMEEFNRKQEEAQKTHQEKMQKRQEIERQRQELEDREKELRARQIEAKRKLQAKLAANGSRNGSSPPAEILPDSTNKKPSSQTEALRAQLAALQDEANQLGIDPDAARDEYSSWAPRGRGRGRGPRGSGSFPPRAARGGYGYRGRGGGVQARHSAYAAYSLDNRPKIVALSGVDFTVPENDEALRQYLFGIGEFKDIHADPTTTHVSFKDRKTAEKFMFGISAHDSIPGVGEKVEPAWPTSAPDSETTTTADGDFLMASGLEDEQAARKASIAGSSATAGLEEGEARDTMDHGDMDYEAGEDWGIS